MVVTSMLAIYRGQLPPLSALQAGLRLLLPVPLGLFNFQYKVINFSEHLYFYSDVPKSSHSGLNVSCIALIGTSVKKKDL